MGHFFRTMEQHTIIPKSLGVASLASLLFYHSGQLKYKPREQTSYIHSHILIHFRQLACAPNLAPKTAVISKGWN